MLYLFDRQYYKGSFTKIQDFFVLKASITHHPALPGCLISACSVHLFWCGEVILFWNLRKAWEKLTHVCDCHFIHQLISKGQVSLAASKCFQVSLKLRCFEVSTSLLSFHQSWRNLDWNDNYFLRCLHKATLFSLEVNVWRGNGRSVWSCLT